MTDSALCFVGSNRQVLWYDQEQAIEYARARFMILHTRQSVRLSVVDGTRCWHVAPVREQRAAA